MKNAPVAAHAGWPGLIAALAERSDFAFLRTLPPAVACAVLAAPVAIARWLSSQSAVPGDRLSLLVIGAESTDAPDAGRWYALVAPLLGVDCEVETTLAGPELDINFESDAARWAPGAPARQERARLDQLLSDNDRKRYDLAVVFHPGLQKHRGWLEPGGFARVLAAGTPLIASSYEVDEFEMDRWVLESYGYRASAAPLLNPFFLELGDERARVRWGRALWAVEAAPAPGFAIDVARLSALDNLTRMVMHSMTSGEQPTIEPGAHVRLQTPSGHEINAIHVFDGRFVDAQNGCVWQLDQAQGLAAHGEIPLAKLADYPGAAARGIDRAVWAARIKAEFLLPAYRVTTPSDVSDATARGMLANMRARAAKLFSK